MRIVVTQGRKPLGGADLNGTRWTMTKDGFRNVEHIFVNLSESGAPTAFAITDRKGTVLMPGTLNSPIAERLIGHTMNFHPGELHLSMNPWPGGESGWPEKLTPPAPERRQYGGWRALLGVSRA